MTLQELESFFATAELPDTIQLDRASRITNVRNFVDTNILRAGLWKGDPDKCPPILHLRQLVNVLQNKLK